MSLTDRCNLRCSYCMPAEGLEWLPDDTVLSDDEVVRLIDIAVHLLGVREVRFTGGEPLVRRGLVDIVRRTAALDPRPETSITTNALLMNVATWSALALELAIGVLVWNPRARPKVLAAGNTFLTWFRTRYPVPPTGVAPSWMRSVINKSVRTTPRSIRETAVA